MRVVKYLGVQLTTDLSFDYHVEQSANSAAGELGAARAAVAAFGGLRRAHALVAYVAYGRAYVEWAAPVYGALSAAAASRLKRLRRSAVSLLVGDGGSDGGDAVSMLLGELPSALRLATAAARYAVDLVAAAAVFPQRACSRYSASATRRPPRPALPWCSSVSSCRTFAASACPHKVARGRADGARAARRHARCAGVATRVRHARSGTRRLRVLADEWGLVPVMRERIAGAVTRDMCDLCGAACAGDLAHVLLACPCAELAAVRGPWLADVESALHDAALGGWWAGLPATIDGRGAVALGRLVEAPPDVARPLRAELTRVFLRHFGAWWARAGDGAVARLAVH